MDDLIAYAQCEDLPGCGMIIPDAVQDVCTYDLGVVACIPYVPCPTLRGTYLANGSDIEMIVYAYDRIARDLYLGLRLPIVRSSGTLTAATPGVRTARKPASSTSR